MFYLFIEITGDHFIWFFSGVISIVLALSLLAVAKKNIREEFYKPIYVFIISTNFVVRRRRTAEMFEMVTKHGTLIEAIHHQVFPNSGGSLKDQITRIETDAADIKEKQGWAIDKFRYQDEISTKCLFEIDPQMKVIFVNRALCELLGAEKEDLLYKNWINSIFPSERERVLKEWSLSIEYRTPFESTHLVIDKTKPQHPFEITVYGKPSFDADGNLRRFFGIVR